MTLLALIVVLIAAWFAIRFLSKLNQLHPSAIKQLTILQTVAVGSRERLVLVRYKENDLLLGVTSGGISVVSSTESETALASETDESPGLQIDKDSGQASVSSLTDILKTHESQHKKRN